MSKTRYEQVVSLDKIKCHAGIDNDALDKLYSEMEEILQKAKEEVAKRIKIAEDAYSNAEDFDLSCPDERDGFMELSDKDANAEYEKHSEVMAYTGKIWGTVTRLEKIHELLNKVV